MTRWLVIKIPEDEQTRDTLNAFYEHAGEKCDGDFDPDIQSQYRQYLEETKEYKLEKYQEEDEMTIDVNMARKCHMTDAWDSFEELFEPEQGDIIRTISDPQELKELLSILIQIKSELKEYSERDPAMDNSPEEWELELETGAISCVEFARKRGYGVRAPY